MVKESISKKIKALLNKTVENGCSESEAIASAQKAQELLNKHNLSMSEVEFCASTFETLNIDTGKKKRDYMYRLVNYIAKFTDCYTYFNHSRGRVKYSNLTYVFFGEKTSTEIANFLYDLLLNAIEFESKRYKNSEDFKILSFSYSSRTIMNSFRTGMAIRLAQRLEEMKIEKDRQNMSDNSIVLYDRVSIVKNKFHELNSDITISSASAYKTSISTDAFESGKSKADEVNITTGLKKGDNKILKLN